MSRTLPIWGMKQLCEIIDDWVTNQYDPLVIIEGWTGKGKSTILWKLACRVKNFKKFNPKRDLIYKQKLILDAVQKRKNMVIGADELINVAYKRDFYQQVQKDLIKAWNKYRTNFNCLIGCVPFFSDLDPDLRKMARLRISIIERGFAVVHTRVEGMFSRDPWDTLHNEAIERKWAKNGIIKPNYGQLTTARAILVYTDMKPKHRELYESIRARKRGEADGLEDEDKKESFNERIFSKLINKELTIEQLKDACFFSGKKYQSVRDWLNRALRDRGYKMYVKDLIISKTKNKKESGPTDELGFH